MFSVQNQSEIHRFFRLLARLLAIEHVEEVKCSAALIQRLHNLFSVPYTIKCRNDDRHLSCHGDSLVLVICHQIPSRFRCKICRSEERRVGKECKERRGQAAEEQKKRDEWNYQIE